MISRRSFVGGCLCGLTVPAQARPRGHLIFCASESSTDAEFHLLQEIDWTTFYISDVPKLVSGCFNAYSLQQRIKFSDQAPLQASLNDIDEESPASSEIRIGVGNLALFPYSTLVAVILHELGHFYCWRSAQWETISSYAGQKRIELLADFMAGAAYARMEPTHLQISERVSGQCSEINLPWVSAPKRPMRQPSRAAGRLALDPRRLGRMDGKAEFFVLRGGRVSPLQNNALIGTSPEEDPQETRCTTTQQRSLDFLAMAGAVSSWRTFGDRPATESHGTPAQRHEAFSLGYETARADQNHTPAALATSLSRGMKYLSIGP